MSRQSRSFDTERQRQRLLSRYERYREHLRQEVGRLEVPEAVLTNMSIRDRRSLSSTVYNYFASFAEEVILQKQLIEGRSRFFHLIRKNRHDQTALEVLRSVLNNFLHESVESMFEVVVDDTDEFITYCCLLDKGLLTQLYNRLTVYGEPGAWDNDFNDACKYISEDGWENFFAEWEYKDDSSTEADTSDWSEED